MFCYMCLQKINTFFRRVTFLPKKNWGSYVGLLSLVLMFDSEPKFIPVVICSIDLKHIPCFYYFQKEKEQERLSSQLT